MSDLGDGVINSFLHRTLNQSNKETVFAEAEPEMERSSSSSSSSSWLRTLTIQLSLCFALYVVINSGHPQNLLYNHPLDLYFLSVRGGFRSLQQHTHLLKLMEIVTKAYDVKFVVNISELGEDDPLMPNVTRLSPILNVPWYTTGGSKCDGLDCFVQQIKLPGGRMLDIVGLNTTSLQDTALVGLPSGTRDSLSNWLTRKLKATVSSWRIVVGFHPLVACDEDGEQSVEKLINEPLHRIFVKFGVNVYLSQQGCISYALRDSVAYIGNPGLTKQKSLSDSANERHQATKEMTNGFLLHRLNSLEMVTYFVTSAGEIVNKIVVRQRGREVM